ncbi:MAG: hypothetical protein MJ186_03190 [Clostridia bacterium]|nr:hypothetical protein [Clostridia bacterium]
MAVYLNFYFRELEVDGTMVQGIFDSPEDQASCNFLYDLETRDYEIWNCSKPEDELLPLPFNWLNIKFKENGCLRKNEGKISY